MNVFGLLLSLSLLASSCLAEVVTSSASDRDYSQPATTFEDVPATSYGSTYYPVDNGFSSGNTYTSYPSTNTGVSTSNFFGDLLNFGGNVVGTVLNIALGLFFLSLILQIVSKVLQSPLLEDLLWDKARSLSEDDMLTYGSMVYNAYKNMENINSSIPK